MVLPLLVSILLPVTQAFDIQYYLSTSPNCDQFTQVGPNNVSKYIVSNYKTHLFIYGWGGSRNTTIWYKNLRTALCSRSNYNIIEVDYTQVSKQPYDQAVKHSAQVGDQIGDLLLNITGYSLKNVHVTGLSLGGQIAGRVGKRVKSRTHTTMGRVNAMDPAGPFFEPPLVLSSYVINRTDADVVFVIHTNQYIAGYYKDCGTVDVYPNGGIFQKGCESLDLVTLIGCSHLRSMDYFIYAVAHPQKLYATRCDNYASFLARSCNNNRKIDLGGELNGTDDGRYFLRTNPAAPYR